MKNVIIIPTYNERGNIERLIPRVFELYADIHIVVVDDNSPDGTQDIINQLIPKYKSITLRSRPAKLGLASAYLDTIRWILREHPETKNIITMDADLSHDPKVIGLMLKEIAYHDLIIGSRYITGGSFQNWAWWRKLLSWGGNIYARVICKVPIRDMTGGFHCFRTDLLRKYDFNTIRSTGYSYQIEMKMNAYWLGARIKELPITFIDRSEGKSKLSNTTVLEGVIAPWRLRMQYMNKREKKNHA